MLRSLDSTLVQKKKENKDKYIFAESVHMSSQTTLTSFCLFLTTYPPRTLTKNRHFLTNYLPLLVNIVCEQQSVNLFLDFNKNTFEISDVVIDKGFFFQKV